MKLQERLSLDLKESMLKGYESKKSLLRVIIGDVNRIGRVVEDDQVIAILKKMKENAIEMNNPEEVEIIDLYLPTMLSEKELEANIVRIIRDNNISSVKEMGVVMKVLKTEFGSLVDGKVASDLIKRKLL
jgi:uncharacterized protein YqeY